MVHAGPQEDSRIIPDRRRTVVDEVERRRMVDALPVKDARVREALYAVPREAFVDVDPFADTPQPIGAGQTISAPHMVAIMAEALDVRPGQRVLEVGGGSGYHAAVLAHLARPARVVSVEVVPELAARARATLRELRIDNVDVIEADGSMGYPPLAPYDRISVAAGAPRVPPPLVDQLAPDGWMLIPIGPLDMQMLTRVEADGSEEPLMAVRFVPMRGAHGWRA